MSQPSEHLETLFANLRRTERCARARLLTGCATDDDRLEQFFEHPLRLLEYDAVAMLDSMGGRDAFDRLGLAFARVVCANIGLRARARLKTYAKELADAEIAIAQAIAAMRIVRAKRLLPKMFAIRRLAIDDLRVPEPPERASEVRDWVDELHGLVRIEVQRRIEEGRSSVLAHGTARLGIIKTRMALAAFR